VVTVLAPHVGVVVAIVGVEAEAVGDRRSSAAHTGRPATGVGAAPGGPLCCVGSDRSLDDADDPEDPEDPEDPA